MDVEPLVRYWTLHSPNGEMAICELVRTPQGLEVRCQWSGGGAQSEVPRAAAVEAMSDALNLAEAWKATYLAKGWTSRARPAS